MNKLVYTIGLLVSLAGCDLYFGNHGGGGSGTWNYCGSDGYYQCQGDSCTWVGSTCPSGSGSGSTGASCSSSTQCAAGCYCANGTCEEGGFCTTDGDCGPGYHCNTSRSSCEPNPVPPPPTTCTTDASCPAGQYCSGTGTCTASCICSSDAQATAQGFGFCDELRQTCMPGSDPAGVCAGTPTCNQGPPTCAPGDVPLLGADGCWNGQCEAATSCGTPPSCKWINDETDCTSRTDCQPIYNGINCTKADGTACHSGDTGCTCQSYVYASCSTHAM